jgi:hypothetical protein
MVGGRDWDRREVVLMVLVQVSETSMLLLVLSD